jgi:hypothetical protein
LLCIQKTTYNWLASISVDNELLKSHLNKLWENIFHSYHNHTHKEIKRKNFGKAWMSSNKFGKELVRDRNGLFQYCFVAAAIQTFY